jgi:DNA-binding LytR/AlgR family response regulator
MLHIAICDDQVNQVNKIRLAVEHYTTNRNIMVSIYEFDNPLLFLEELDRTGGVDILLLDICMPGVLGTEVAKEIRKRKDKTEIIFITTSDEFAVVAFALKAAHYLLKPFTQNQFDEAMDRAMDYFDNGMEKRITLKLENGNMKMINLDEIYYIESAGHTQAVYMEGEICIEARRSLTRLAEEAERISPGQFISPYKGYLVNQKAIRNIETKQMILLNGKCIPLSRGSFRQLQNAFFEYQFREGVRR